MRDIYCTFLELKECIYYEIVSYYYMSCEGFESMNMLH